jgi:DNA invertase Pin-like site-specific DNA recombinase
LNTYALERNKVNKSHLSLNAYLYIRQSSMHQVLENTESTKRQYQLRERALALGWKSEQIFVIDSDQAQSGASQAGRTGFQFLVSEVSMRKAGLVMGLEVSRLARNNADWHRLLELCSFSGALILDQDGLYDPSTFNDRLLLGLKGAMSEAELHIIKSRLQMGVLNKARRGELKIPLPAGFEYDELDRVILCRNQQVRDVISKFFVSFKRLKSATAVAKEFRREGIKMPRFDRAGKKSAKIFWSDITHSQALRILHNPRYSGAFAFGRTRSQLTPEGRRIFGKKPEDEWIALIKNSHEGYITWEEYKSNQKTLHENSAAYRTKREKTPPREGPALLQGVAICGKCGKVMAVRYHKRKDKLVPDYICQRDRIENLKDYTCQYISGITIEKAIETLIPETVNEANIDAALSVYSEMRKRMKETDVLRRSEIERCRYEADLARKRYMNIDPDQRYVAEVLEAEWNEKLRLLDEACENYEKSKKKEAELHDANNLKNLKNRLANFSTFWREGNLSNLDKKRIVRLIIEDVTIIAETVITCHIRFRGGAVKTINLPAPKTAWETRTISKEAVKQIDVLLDNHTYAEVADILNNNGYKTGTGQKFDADSIKRVRYTYKLDSFLEISLRNLNLLKK